MKVLKHIINWTVWTIVGLYAISLFAINTPWAQDRLGDKLSQLVGQKLGTKVRVGRVDLGLLNRLILDSVVVYDQQQQEMLRVNRMTAKIEVAPLAVGRIAISSAQIFGAHLQLYKPSKDAPANFQFALDSLASKDTTNQTPLDLRINSFIMRHSSVSYDQWDVTPTPGKLNPQHLNVSNISAHIILKALKDDSLNVNVKRVTFLERSGLDVKRLSFKLAAGKQHARLHELQLQLPGTSICMDSLTSTYDQERLRETLCFKGKIDNTQISPADFGSLLPQLRQYRHRMALTTRFDYKDNTLNVPQFQLSSDGGDLALTGNGRIKQPAYGNPVWLVNVDQMHIADEMLNFVSNNVVKLPDEVLRLGNIQLSGSFGGDAEGTLHTLSAITTDIGHVDTQLQLKDDKQFAGNVKTDGIDVGKLLDNEKIGIVATNIEVNGTADRQIAAKGRIEKLEYDGYSYTNIDLDGSYAADQIAGLLQIDDPRITANLQLDLKAKTINDAVGKLSLHNLSLPEKDYHLDYLLLESGYDEGRHFVTLKSDFAHASLSGEFDYTTLAQSIANAVGSKLPTLPGLPPNKPSNNNFTLNLALGKTDWLQKFLDVDLDVAQPVLLEATVNDRTRQITVDLQAPSFSYGSTRYCNGSVHITSPSDTMFVKAAISSLQDSGTPFDLKVDGKAADNNLSVVLAWDNNSAEKPVCGLLNTTSRLYRNLDNQPEAHVTILPSNVFVDNSVWQIEPADVLYSTDRLLVDHFSVHNGQQYIAIDGTASKENTDSLVVDLHNVEVAYILDLVNFDAVTFAGKASGKAYLSSVFNDPTAYANLKVSEFEFQDGRMGTLLARVDWNKQDKQIDIRATANDGPDAMTYINGYVSPEREFIDLGISACGTYLDFMHSFTESFISHITGHGNGDLRLAGPLSAINLTGNLVVDGEATITPLNTTYWLRNDSLTLVYNEIKLDHMPIYDKYNNVAYLSGGVYHQDLTNLSLALHVETDNLLGYDFHDFGENSFYGTVFAAGDVDITMKGNDVHIDCNVTPLKNSVFVYNAANPDAISNQEFITWKTATDDTSAAPPAEAATPDEPTTNIYMNFLVNATPQGTMRLLMDAKTNDYINLNGNGSLQATYYNKGTFQMFGTYTVDHGTYDVTIQNIIKKNFQFQSGGTIVFGGDPYAAALNLQALYTVNGVSLSDLQLGNSFSSNTVRVNCLMNIGGQPSAPQVTFDLDLPNVNADEKQMVRSLLSSQQEMNQQVLYLLGIGRFYSQQQNNAGQQQQQDQTALAMQSFLSGTLSTQINTVINQIVKNEDWNFGANISTGTEGWNNAEYEGIVNGRMLNNRLLVNGQFGYRDNATQATPSFIGDFDVSYLLYPNGNLALKVYNQTNDRYFTRSSLNTQGLGIILKKDFNGLSDFFGIKKKHPQDTLTTK